MSDSALSPVYICNSALLKVGGDLISSLTDGSRAANICNTLYTVLRDKCMGDAPWRFAIMQVQLAPLAQAPLFDYQYAYQLPDDCLRPLSCESDPWTVMAGGILLCNSPTINLTYIQRNTDESSWDERFAEAFALLMSREIALALVQSAPLAQAMDKMYQAAIKDARALNAVVGTPKHLIVDLWSNARKGYNYLGPVIGELSEPYGPI